jgi:hypothetical protein
LGEAISMEVEVDRLKTVSFNPKSAKTRISSSVAPKLIDVILAVPEVGLEIFAANCWFVVE